MREFIRKYRRSIIKLLIFTVVGILLYVVFSEGQKLESSIGYGILYPSIQKTTPASKFINLHSISILILQILVIIAFSRLLARLMSKIGQPTVIGEIIAGIMLGPSLLGLYAPEVFSFIFPVESLSKLEFLSQIGLMLFMFIIGMELDLGIIRSRAREALFISNAGIVIPYIMGVSLAYFLYEVFAPKGVGFISFSLFIGIALSITAFPVLARIVQERGMTKTALGTIVITSAAIDDISAWGILAIVVAIANAGAITAALVTILLSMVYIAFMIYLVKPFLNKLALKYTVHETISKTVVASVFSIMLISSFITEVIGIHALFGAFMAGIIMPENKRFKSIMTEKIEDVSLVLLLPLFFVFTGLRTEIGLLNEGRLWLYAALVMVIAITGKFAGTAIAARFVGLRWKDSLTIGALMNTRGLIELVALNIGYDIGILSPEIFTILVLMALITTFMTGPAMSLINYAYRSRESLATVSGLFKVLISFGPPLSGARLLTMVNHLFSREKDHLAITALHLTPNTEISKESALLFEEQAFKRIHEIAAEEKLDLKTEYRTTQAVSQEITRTANRGKFNLLVVGSSRPLLSSDKTGGKARYFFENVKCDIALVIDNGFTEINNVLIICMDTPSREYMYTVAARFNEHIKTDIECLKEKKDLEKDYTQYDLIITGLECYRTHHQLSSPWALGPVSIMVFSRYE